MSENLRFLFTGGPGAGKTTILELLAQRGYTCVPEVAREIIQKRMRQGLSPRPKPIEFAREILEEDLRQYDTVNIEGPVFFDRGTPDALGMIYEAGSSLTHVQIIRHLYERPYNPTAFFFPYWEEIFKTDSERDQSPEQALSIAASIRNWYHSVGFTIVEVPRASPEERVTFILKQAERLRASE